MIIIIVKNNMVLLFRRGPRLRNILYTVRSKCLFFWSGWQLQQRTTSHNELHTERFSHRHLSAPCIYQAHALFGICLFQLSTMMVEFQVQTTSCTKFDDDGFY